MHHPVRVECVQANLLMMLMMLTAKAGWGQHGDAEETRERSRGGKRGGAREHCSQKEIDKTTLGGRIWAKFTALVLIFIKSAIYCTFAVGPMKN